MDTELPIELRNWTKEQLRSIERGELEDWKKYAIIDLIQEKMKEGNAEIFAILLKEVSPNLAESLLYPLQSVCVMKWDKETDTPLKMIILWLIRQDMKQLASDHRRT